ncbi:YqjF family protein [uncultured Nocardioides sp.]|uniref:YqjF family protein n=1 Tax=uncultured Nocardioides sp. TaxID=198441 RepID=UPI0026281B84|nr:DUF2071 domain-containing protein [uncultured Nocardioides sp.]
MNHAATRPDDRPPPLPGRVLMAQDWRDLAFLHWAVDPDRVRPLLPPGVAPDVLHGRTYVGLVPFTMVGAGPGRDRPVPWLGTFLETNVRLYSVDRRGRPGVVFRSLDCDRLAVVLGARSGFGTPYRWARMRHDVLPHALGVRHHWASQVRWPRAGAAGARTRIDLVVGDRREPTELDVFLTARWALHTQVAGRPLHIRNSHAPWPLHDVTLLDLDDHVVAAAGLPGVTDREPDHLAFSPGVHTRFAFPSP